MGAASADLVEALALAKSRAKLEEGWRQLSLERSRLELATGASAGISSVCPPSAPPPGTAPAVLRFDTPRRRAEAAPKALDFQAAKGPSPAVACWQELGKPISERLQAAKAAAVDQPQVALASQATDPWNYVPSDCQVAVKEHAYSVLPVQSPDAAGMGHDLWNHTVEIPEGWEVLSSEAEDFDDAMAALTRHRWGAIVLGVRGSGESFDAYWTPMFGDGSHAGLLCQEDVDWIETEEGSGKRFRMTYSGLRLVMRRPLPAGR